MTHRAPLLPKEAKAQGVIMVEWESGMPLGSKLCVASRAFKHDVREILLSDFDKGLE